MWISLLAQAFLLAAELNVVLKERRWPRSFQDKPRIPPAAAAAP
ncbi:MAG: hypothetical protein M3P23_16385 [Actinomycetota bacterium]|nr:hypothetical protein [Actinomycetota bacterium]